VVHVLGAGFIRAARYSLSLTAEGLREVAQCEAASCESLSCTLPRWIGAAARVTLSLEGPFERERQQVTSLAAPSGATVAYAGTSLIRPPPPPYGHHRALDIVLL